MRAILLATVATIGMFTAADQDYRLDPATFPRAPAADSPEAESWARAAELSVRAHRMQQKTDRAWLRARLAWSRYETERDFAELPTDEPEAE